MGSQTSKDKEDDGNWTEIPEENIEYLLGHDGRKKLLGSGGAGSVYLAVYKHELVAVKKLHNPDLENERNEFIMEMRVLAELDSPFVIRYLGGSLTDNILVTEFMQNGDLRHAIMTRNPMVRWENRGAAILLDVARGLAFLHGQRFIHRDLKSPNILLSSDFHAKLADVGIARALKPGQTQIDTMTVKFSLRWASPENFTKTNYTILTDRSDVYSFGVIMWEVVAQELPWANERWEFEICNFVKIGQHNPIPESCPPRVAALMKACWALNPEERPSAEQIVTELEDILANHPPLEPVENLVLRFSGTASDGDPKVGPDGNLVLKEGTLSLRSVWLQMWHIRYFTLTSRNIIYWTYQNNQKAREIRISLFKIRKTKFYRNTATAAGCMFEFVTFSRTYIVIASSVNEAADWVAAIELAKGNTTSTRDTVMAAASDHPNPSSVFENYGPQGSPEVPKAKRAPPPELLEIPPKAPKDDAPSSGKSRPKANTMRGGKSEVGKESKDSTPKLPSSQSSKFSFMKKKNSSKQSNSSIISTSASSSNSTGNSANQSTSPPSKKAPLAYDDEPELTFNDTTDFSSFLGSSPSVTLGDDYDEDDYIVPPAKDEYIVLPVRGSVRVSRSLQAESFLSASMAPSSYSKSPKDGSGLSPLSESPLSVDVTSLNRDGSLPGTPTTSPPLSPVPESPQPMSTKWAAASIKAYPGRPKSPLLLGSNSSALISRSVPDNRDMDSKRGATRPQGMSQPDPFMPSISTSESNGKQRVNEIEVHSLPSSEKRSSFETHEEVEEETCIPASALAYLRLGGRLSGHTPPPSSPSPNSSAAGDLLITALVPGITHMQVSHNRAISMKQERTVLTPCYYCTDSHNNQPPPIVLNLGNVESYQELFETVFDGFLEQFVDGKGFSLWSKLVADDEEHEILESEFDDWRACIDKVDRIIVKNLSTAHNLVGDNDENAKIFRKSRRMSVTPSPILLLPHTPSHTPSPTPNGHKILDLNAFA